MKRNLKDKESREFWEFVDRIVAEVAKWPSWMRGDSKKGGAK